MKIAFSNSKTTISTGRNGDYDCTGIGVSLNNWGSPQLHTLALEGYGKRGNVVKGDLIIPIADVPALINTLVEMHHNYLVSQNTHEQR